MCVDGWYGIARVVPVGLSSYAALIALLRISGKRTLSKLNAFDLVVTKALSSTFATVLLPGAMRLERVTADEIESVVRGAGMGSLEQAGAAVLKADGTFHGLPMGQAGGLAMPGVGR